MGYKIHYGETMEKETISESPAKKRSSAVWWILTAVCIFIFLFNAGGLQEYLLPDTDSVAGEAMSEFAQNVKEGQPVVEAFRTFCLEIIENADLS